MLRNEVLDELAARAVPDTVDLWPALNARIQPTKPSALRWAGAVAAALVVAMVGLGLVPLLSTPEAVSAETILDRAESANGVVSTYHLLMTRLGKDAGSTIKSEVWYDGPDRQRTIQQVIGANGAVLSRQDVVFNGSETWIEDTQNSATRVIHTIGTTWTRPADSPTADANLSELLKTFGDKSCMATRLEQTVASIAGQPTYVVSATPRTPGCGEPRIRVNGQPAGGAVSAPTQLTVWVDKRSFLPLKMEVRDNSGVVVDRSEVTSVRYDMSIPSSTFAYVAPAGVTVATFSGGNGADVKRALASQEQDAGKPTKGARQAP